MIGSRQCLFCDNSADTKEHLWPDWILRILKGARPIRQVLGKSPPNEFHGDVRIRCVCRGCNGGWMSSLEETVKPFLSQLIHGASLALDARQQELTSIWALKVAMVLETVNTTTARCYARNECEQLRVNSLIPERSMIWLGRISESGVFAAGTYLWLYVDDLPEPHYGCVTTLTVGHLAIQVLTAHFSAQYQSVTMQVRCLGGEFWNDALIGICPAPGRSVSWPPALTFTPRGPLRFVELRDRFKTGTSMWKRNCTYEKDGAD